MCVCFCPHKCNALLVKPFHIITSLLIVVWSSFQVALASMFMSAPLLLCVNDSLLDLPFEKVSVAELRALPQRMATANSGAVRYIIYMGALSPSSHCLQSGNIPVIGDKLTAGPPRWVIMSAAILDNCSTVAEAAGVGLVSAEYQPSLLAHIQPSVLISRYVLTIALMCSPSPQSRPCLCHASAAIHL